MTTPNFVWSPILELAQDPETCNNTLPALREPDHVAEEMGPVPLNKMEKYD